MDALIFYLGQAVAPYAGAWIEISQSNLGKNPLIVAPYAGAWIEIAPLVYCYCSRIVAPYAGAWIEIRYGRADGDDGHGRSLRGSVD